MSKKRKKKCCLCGIVIDGYGNNPYPLADKNRKCCDFCNLFVIKERLRLNLQITDEVKYDI